jgi:hexosaminidase
MKKFVLILAFLAILSKGEASESRNLIPLPAEVTWQEGSLAINSSFNFTLQGAKEARVEAAAERFLERLSKRTEVSFSASSGKSIFVIECKGAGLPVQSFREDESYTLTVTPTGAKLSAANPLGILHGLETFLQLVEKGNSPAVPCVTIKDKPRFAWRGLLIDACRHWQPMEVIKRNLDGLAEAKMNVLHWHLSEDQGFRVESKKYPKLQELASDGKYYTQQDIKDVVAYARARGIRVIPEFDMPGHTTALLAAYPEWASAPGPFKIERKFGVFDPTMDPTNEEVYKFIDGFLDEMAVLFPDEYFHIGGDEVNSKQWNSNNDILDFIYKHKLKTNDDLQTYFNSRVLPLLTQHKKKMVGWDEILHPDLPKTIVVQSWRGAGGLVDCAKQGYDTILSNGYYLDNIRPASVHYGVDPIPAKSELTLEQKSHVLGGEACMWAEFVSPETIDSRIWPRTLAVAERLWSPQSTQDLADFYRRMEVESLRLDELGLTHNSNYRSMLKRLVGAGGLESLKVLADVVEPLKLYHRPRSRAYTSETPLNRLADAARPESKTAREFKIWTDHYLDTIQGAADFQVQEVLKALRDDLMKWRDNHKKLEPILAKSKDLVEISFPSRDLSILSQLGLEAVQFIESGKSAPAAWQVKAEKNLKLVAEPRAEVEIALIPAVKKLVLAASQFDKLKTMSYTEWNQSLEKQLEDSKRNPWH